MLVFAMKPTTFIRLPNEADLRAPVTKWKCLKCGAKFEDPTKLRAHKETACK